MTKNIMARHFAAIGIVLVFPFFLAASTLAEEAKQVVDSLFAVKIKTVTATTDRADDIALAKEILAVAKTSTDSPALLAILCESSYDLSVKHAEGARIAEEAMSLLAEVVMEKRSVARERLVVLLTKQAAAGKPEERDAAGDKLVAVCLSMGDDKMEAKKWSEAAVDYRKASAIAVSKKSPKSGVAASKLEEAVRLDRADKQIRRLQAKLLENANDIATAEELVKLHLIDMDDPKAASLLSARIKDAQLIRVLAASSTSLDSLTEEAALEAGEWFKKQATATKGPRAAFVRARVYYRRFMDLHTANDLTRKVATLALEQIEAELSTIEKPSEITIHRICGDRTVQKVVEGDSEIVPDEFKVAVTGRIVRISGTKRSDTARIGAIEAGHFGKAVGFPITSGSGKLTVAVGMAFDNTYYSAIFLDKDGNGTWLEMPLMKDLTYIWKLESIRENLRLRIYEGDKSLGEIELPASKFSKLCFGATGRYPGNAADMTITLDR